MEDFEKLREELATITAERDALKAEVEELKNGKFDAGAYIERLKAQTERDLQAKVELEKRFL